MTDPQRAPAPDDPFFHMAGLAAMTLPQGAPSRFYLLDGGRRRLADRTPGAANLTSIQGDKK